MPEQYLDNYVVRLSLLHPLAAGVLIVLSAAFLLRGWKFYKYLITLDALVAGVVLGAAVGRQLARPHMDLYLAAGLGLVFAVTAWPLMKASVSVLGALAGAAIGYVFWYYGTQAAGAVGLSHYAWVGALVGAVIVAMLTFIAFQTTVILGLGLQGALMLMSGIFAILLRLRNTSGWLSRQINDNSLFLPLMILIPGLLAIIYQQSQYLQGQARKRKAAMQKGTA